jgi:hypothetical protein
MKESGSIEPMVTLTSSLSKLYTMVMGVPQPEQKVRSATSDSLSVVGAVDL